MLIACGVDRDDMHVRLHVQWTLKDNSLADKTDSGLAVPVMLLSLSPRPSEGDILFRAAVGILRERDCGAAGCDDVC